MYLSVSYNDAVGVVSTCYTTAPPQIPHIVECFPVITSALFLYLTNKIIIDINVISVVLHHADLKGNLRLYCYPQNICMNLYRSSDFNDIQ